MNVIIPKSGMGIEEGTILRWMKEVGDKVRKGEPLAEIETAKSTQEIEAPTSGVVISILFGVGTAAPVNTTIAVIEEDEN